MYILRILELINYLLNIINIIIIYDISYTIKIKTLNILNQHNLIKIYFNTRSKHMGRFDKVFIVINFL